MEFTVKATNKEGFPVEIKGEWPDDYVGLLARLTDPDLGWVAGKTVTASSGAAESGDVPESIQCQFNPAHKVQGTPKIGNNGPYSAEAVAKSRAEKMGKMGKKALPVCGDCWNKGGHKSDWDVYYTSNRG